MINSLINSTPFLQIMNRSKLLPNDMLTTKNVISNLRHYAVSHFFSLFISPCSLFTLFHQNINLLFMGLNYYFSKIISSYDNGLVVFCAATGLLFVFITIDYHSWKQVYLFFVVNLRSPAYTKVKYVMLSISSSLLLSDGSYALFKNKNEHLQYTSVFYLNCTHCMK